MFAQVDLTNLMSIHIPTFSFLVQVQEYMRRKAEAEAARQQELEQQRLEREKELARLRAMQQRAADVQAAKDEMNAMRIQDEVNIDFSYFTPTYIKFQNELLLFGILGDLQDLSLQAKL